MNERQEQLYNNLMSLVHTNDAFFYQDCIVDECKYRIFNYRLSSYSDFLLPDAMECRGTMFQVDADDKAIRLAAWPMSKFFNLHENPSTMDLDLTTIESIVNKADGSLISTYIHNDELRLKSKGATESIQAIDAMKWLDLPENAQYKMDLYSYAEMGYTVNIEWVGPSNRIVLGYMEPSLIVLNIRDNLNGSYMTNYTPTLQKYLDPEVNLNGLSLIDFVNRVPDMQDDIEGFVVKLSSGVWFKIKTNKYKKLHLCKSNINNPRRLFESIVTEGLDDLLSLFVDDKLLIKQITDEQIRVNHIYNQLVASVERFYSDNKSLDRKDYAILGQKILEKPHFGLAMMLYLGKSIDYKEFMIKHYEMFASPQLTKVSNME